MHIHFITEKDILILEEIFAVLTEQGWVIPNWLIQLRNTVTPVKECDYSIDFNL